MLTSLSSIMFQRCGDVVEPTSMCEKENEFWIA